MKLTKSDECFSWTISDFTLDEVTMRFPHPSSNLSEKQKQISPFKAMTGEKTENSSAFVSKKFNIYTFIFP